MPEPLRRAGEALLEGALYTISLPERYLRGLTGLLGGMLKETTDLVIPDFVKDTTSYNLFVGNILRFAVENVGGVEGLYRDDGLDGDYATRKLLGNAIEGVGVATVHISPLWVFAFFADSVKGGQAYLNRLHAEMVAKGYLDADSEPGSLQELLDGLERTTASFAKNIDVPPLSRKEVMENIGEIRESIGELLTNTGRAAEGVTDEVATVMQDFLDTATDEGQSLLELGGVMTLQATARAKQAAGVAVAAPQVAGKMLYENILGYYGDTLADIHEHGYATVASETIEPYGNAIMKQFSNEQETWTEKLFRGSARGLKHVFGMQTSK
ncbi:MAG: hypothetical protein QF822_05200 [Candidatus Poseidoniia archaeon]|jgi:hypothetical protein|nr:hypothetical protein [Euryarchaeota archaeon]MDP6489239.1 hypothetical protein [Candidatus Poseidoniia archaeon]MDP6534599.1 hypothetical protein [Candidatus Poseidoniia archaeon]MDP6834937.1 hypothetical protein [Candidatus Poseidoniia archaeon]|tara:strand:- start:117 stop:1094 length:978 start_codon:yes stop_codon:yes gene_type:complete